MFTLAIGRVNILGSKHLITFTPSTRYFPVRHSPSFAIPQLSPTLVEVYIFLKKIRESVCDIKSYLKFLSFRENGKKLLFVVIFLERLKE